jgi:hypothetical protein
LLISNTIYRDKIVILVLLAGEQLAPALSLQSDVQHMLGVPCSSQTSSNEKTPSQLPWTFLVIDRHFGLNLARFSVYFLAMRILSNHAIQKKNNIKLFLEKEIQF